MKKQENILNSKDIVNPLLKTEVSKNSKLKKWLVNYVGSKTKPQDGAVTIEMIIDVMSKEFPDFLMVVAEENFIRGYKQGIADSDAFQKLKKDKDVEH